MSLIAKREEILDVCEPLQKQRVVALENEGYCMHSLTNHRRVKMLKSDPVETDRGVLYVSVHGLSSRYRMESGAQLEVSEVFVVK